jgi:NOL1/NOP2/sun family putative RNA methylase
MMGVGCFLSLAALLGNGVMMVDARRAQHLARRYGYLDYMVTRYLALFGQETEAFLAGNEQPLARSIRANTLVAGPNQVAARLGEKGFALEAVTGLPYAFWVREGSLPLGATSEYLLGQYTLQSVASMWAVEALNPRQAHLVADICAAPGGKTTLIAQLMENRGALLATDISRMRMRALRSNLSRMRVENALVMRMDAAQLPETGLQVDAVLLDAPCTGEGLIPVDPTRKQSRQLEDLATLAAVQRKLIVAAAALLPKGGILVYSTCSFAPEENEQIIDYALQKCPLRVTEPGVPVGDPAFTAPFGQTVDRSLVHARRFYPYKHGTEGFFICRLEKTAG